MPKQQTEVRRDEVDELVATWERERPDLDFSPLHILSRVGRLARRLELARGVAFGVHGLALWEFDVLSSLRRSGQPFEMTAGALMRETLVTSGTMTNRIDRLVDRGLVERLRDPRDRRGVLVRLTDDGRSRVDSAIADLLEREAPLIAPLAPGEQGELAGLLRRLMTSIGGGS
jgi:DNA-binding MarR family transcriptional regulator